MARVYSLLSRAKDQLGLIERRCPPQAAEEEAEEPGGGHGDPQGPRIKHVCRHAAVALGQARATVPESVPRLSALPPPTGTPRPASPTKPPPPETSSASEAEGGRGKRPRPGVPSGGFGDAEAGAGVPSGGFGDSGSGGGGLGVPPSRPPPRKNRQARCGRCRGCRRLQDCAHCPNCRDKRKFGGPNTKKQCCVYRKCDKIEARKMERLARKGRCPPRSTPWESEESGDEGTAGDTSGDMGDPGGDPGGADAPRRSGRRWLGTPGDGDSGGHGDGPPPEEPPPPSRPRRAPLQPLLQLRARRRGTKEWGPPGALEPPQNGWGGAWPSDGVHRLRVDFKEDCALDNVWLMGGLSIVSSVPVTAPLVCLLCASKGLHQLVLCQVCCQPFHAFCLGAEEAPARGERWSCRRCKACQACARRGTPHRPLLECSRCRRCFHPGCLGPGAPPRAPPPRLALLGLLALRGLRGHPGGGGGGPRMGPPGRALPPLRPTETPRVFLPHMRLLGGETGGGRRGGAPPLPPVRPPHRASLGAPLAGPWGAPALAPRRRPPTLPPDPPEGGARQLFIQLMGVTFPWFNAEDPELWRPRWGGGGVLPPPTPDHTYAQGRPEPPLPHDEAEEAVGPPGAGFGGDERLCVLCLQRGDAPPQEAGRLLYLGQNEWAHVNCALWSAEVFEEDDGTLRNVHAAVARGRQMRCELCGRPGATVGCCLAACLANYHFMCARRRRAAFQKDKKVFCHRHTRLLDGTELVGDEDFAVLRRVLVDFGGISLKRKFLGGLEPEAVSVMIGSIRIDSLGALTELSESGGRLFPVGYQCVLGGTGGDWGGLGGTGG
ncbi:histone-lysine N-methyltransferase 2B-like, partial [Phaenicophaeus curvirostris]|uniref:histone-lysine N-methyltransferase 2B-like n=1 Tax=Phaenicophaeus curvirostris TaxID=33595 RepID=UPI0037F0AFE9